MGPSCNFAEHVKICVERLTESGVAALSGLFDLTSQRLVRYANIVGKENVMAGTDCGIGSRVGHDQICWAKFQAMSEGAQIASKELWS